MTTTKIARTSALLAVASTLLAMTAPAFADQDGDLPQGTLNIAGTDFTSAKAVGHLKARLHRVAYDICAPDAAHSITLTPDQRACVNTAINNGMAQIESKQQQALRETDVKVASAQTVTK